MDSTISSGLLTESGVVKASKGLLCDVLILTNGSADATVTIYDNATTNAGTVLFKGKVVGAGLFGGGSLSIPVKAVNGIYALLAGTGANCIVYYR